MHHDADLGFFVPYLDLAVIRLGTPPYAAIPISPHNRPLSSKELFISELTRSIAPLTR